jgi:predicted exporter
MTRRWAILAIWLATLALCVVIAVNSRYSAGMSAFLPRVPDAQEQVLVDQLRDGTVSRLILAGIDGSDAATRAALSRALAARLRADGRFAAVENGAADAQRGAEKLLFARRYLLDPHTTARAFSVTGLHDAIAASIDLLAMPASGLQALLPRDPTGAMLQVIGQLGSAAQARREDGVWAAPGDQRALLLLLTRAAGTDTDAQQAAIDAARGAFAAARRSLGPAAARATLVLSGPGVFAVQSRATIKAAVEHVSWIGGVLIVLLLLLVYRSITVLLLGLLPVLTGIVVAITAVGLGYGVVQGVTLGFGTTLMGEAVDYSVYLFVQAGGGSAARSDWLRRFWPTIRLGMLTSVIGFATLLLSDFPGLAQLGAYSIAGLLSAALVTRFVLPELLPRRFMVRDLDPLGRRLLRAAQVLQRLRWLLLALVLGAAVVLVMHRQHLWNTRLSALSPIPAPALALDAQLRSQLGGPGGSDLVAVSGRDENAALAAAEAVAPRLRQLERQGVIGGFDSPARLLPSLATQQARRAALPNASVLQRRLSAAVRGLPVRAALFEPFVRDVEAARAAPALTRADYAHTPFALALDGMLLRGRDGRVMALLPLRVPRAGAIDGARVAAALAGSAAHYINLGSASSALYVGYLRTAAWLSLAGLGAIALLLLLALRAPMRVLRVLAPLLSAVLVVAAGLLLAGVELTLLHLVGMMLIVAVGSNYALFFDSGASAGNGIAPRTLASLVCANLTTVAGFSPLIFSGVPVLQALGSTVAPGAFLALIFAAMLAGPVHTTPVQHMAAPP